MRIRAEPEKVAESTGKSDNRQSSNKETSKNVLSLKENKHTKGD